MPAQAYPTVTQVGTGHRSGAASACRNAASVLGTSWRTRHDTSEVKSVRRTPRSEAHRSSQREGAIAQKAAPARRFMGNSPRRSAHRKAPASALASKARRCPPCMPTPTRRRNHARRDRRSSDSQPQGTCRRSVATAARIV